MCVSLEKRRAPLLLSRFPSSTILPLLFSGLLIKNLGKRVPLLFGDHSGTWNLANPQSGSKPSQPNRGANAWGIAVEAGRDSLVSRARSLQSSALGGSSVAVSGVLSPLIWLRSTATRLISPSITTHEPPSTLQTPKHQNTEVKHPPILELEALNLKALKTLY